MNIQIDSNDLSDIQKQISVLSADIKKYRARFDTWRKAVLFLPIIVGLIQVLALHSSIDFSVNNYNNWVSIPTVFAVPVGAFSFALAMAGIYGLYLRSLQTDLQLLRAHQQVSISHHQFNLAAKKESMVMFLEHRNHIVTMLKSTVESYNFSFNTIKSEKGISLDVDVGIYARLFPSNSPDSEITLTPDLEIFSKTFEGGGNVLCSLHKAMKADKEVVASQSFVSEVNKWYRVFSGVGFFGIRKDVKKDSWLDTYFKLAEMQTIYDCISRVYISKNENEKIRIYMNAIEKILETIGEYHSELKKSKAIEHSKNVE